MRKMCLLLTLLACACATTKPKNDSKEMAELRALDKQEAWQELYGRLDTVPPTARDEEWQALGEKAVVNLLGSVKTDEYRLEGTLQTLAGLKQQYPTIGKSQAFREKRQEVGLTAFKQHFSDYRHSAGDDEWLTQLKQFVKDDPDSKGLPLAAGKMVSKLLVEATTIPLYSEAAAREPDVACKDEALHAAIVETAAEGDVWREELTKLVNETCSSDLPKALTAAADTAKPKDRKGICDLLKTQPASCTKS